MKKDHIVQRTRILGLIGLVRLGIPRQYARDPTTVRPEVPSEGTLLNVYTIKDKP